MFSLNHMQIGRGSKKKVYSSVIIAPSVIHDADRLLLLIHVSGPSGNYVRLLGVSAEGNPPAGPIGVLYQ